MNKDRFFVSFSSRDYFVADFARHLMIDLKKQGFQVYTYESPNHNLNPSDDIWGKCAREIDRANYVVAIVCDEALQSNWVSKEVQYSQRTKVAKEVFYVNLSRHSSWPPPYDQLKRYLSLLEVDPDLQSYEELDLALSMTISRKICEVLSREYSFHAEDSRLPLRQKIQEEIKGSSDNLRNKRHGHLEELYDCCDEYEQNLSMNKHQKAQRNLRDIINKMESTLKVPVAYYPRVLRFGHKLQLVDSKDQRKKQIQKILKQCKKLESKAGSKLDANLYGILGNAFMASAQYDLAFEAFLTAERMLETIDPAVIHNKIIASISLQDEGLVNDTKTQLNELERKGFISGPSGEISRIVSLSYLIDSYEGKIEKWIRQDEKMENISRHPDLALQAVDLAYDNAVSEQDIRSANLIYDFMLRLITKTSINKKGLELAKLYQRASLLALDLGNMRAATKLITKALNCRNCQRSVQLLSSAALIHHAANQNEKAYDLAKKAIKEKDLPKQPFGTTEDEFYLHRGIAAWLLRMDERANAYFFEAGQPNYQLSQLENWVRREKIRPSSKNILRRFC